MAKNSRLRIALTTGDIDGIGLEVAAKALVAIGEQRDTQFVLWRSPWAEKKHLSLLAQHFEVVSLEDSTKIWETPWAPNQILDVSSTAKPDRWVAHASLACLHQLCDGLVTGPLSKIGMSSHHHIGHTELLSHLSGTEPLFMSFWGKSFSVVLVTGHVSIRKVPRTFGPRLLEKALQLSLKLRESFPQPKRPIAVVGLNPHAGEEGLIGGEEQEWLGRMIQKFSAFGVEGPLVPDTAFLPKMQNKYSIFICPYHDQGLIPFKMVHGFNSGVHVTLGLPFVRTSVDHGTAKELYGLDQAESGSMREAVLTALALVRREQKMNH